MKKLILLTALFASMTFSATSHADPAVKLSELEQKYDIYLNSDWVSSKYTKNKLLGHKTRKITATASGYKVESSSDIQIDDHGKPEPVTANEIYLVDKNLALQSFVINQSFNGITSLITGEKTSNGLFVWVTSLGKSTRRSYKKYSGDIIPEPLIDIYPLINDPTVGKTYRLSVFNPISLSIKNVKISVLSHEKAMDGTPAIKLRNTIHTYVNNDILVDHHGNTIKESIKDDFIVIQPSQIQK